MLGLSDRPVRLSRRTRDSRRISSDEAGDQQDRAKRQGRNAELFGAPPQLRIYKDERYGVIARWQIDNDRFHTRIGAERVPLAVD